MIKQILFRQSIAEENEIAIAKKYFSVVENRVKINDSFVIGRYSVLPYYKELEDDLRYNRSILINSYKQHCWIANFEYYEQLKDYTFETVHEKDFYKWNYDGPMVVKGLTNSRKYQWNTHMYAKNRQDALKVASELHNDYFIGYQNLIYRKYEPLKTFEIGINDIRFTNEWRFFFYRDQEISRGYYWSTADEPELGYINQNGIDFAQKCAKICSDFVDFFALDIAEKENGEWVLVEINDGQQSGLSENDPDLLYSNLKKVLND